VEYRAKESGTGDGSPDSGAEGYGHRAAKNGGGTGDIFLICGMRFDEIMLFPFGNHHFRLKWFPVYLPLVKMDQGANAKHQGGKRPGCYENAIFCPCVVQ
jgi:hypothetical protein